MTADARIARMNRTLADWLGCTADELVGEQVHSILSFGGRIAFETHLAPMLRLQGEVHEIALDLQLADGDKLPVIGNAKEKRGPGGEHLFTRLTLIKANERMTFERSLIEAKVKAEERARNEHLQLELRDQFIAVLGHDLRNPLAAIEAGMRMLEPQGDVSKRNHLIISEMKASLARAHELIDDVLDFARGRLGTGIPLDYSNNVSLEEVLRHVVHETSAVAPDVEVKCELGDLTAVECDTDRIGQLASNLLSNAVRYGDRSKPIVLEALVQDDEFHLTVANQGEPIPEASRERLFIPFQRGEGSDAGDGLGLGLFIVREIARAHGGEIRVFSDRSGTRFQLSMPRTAAPSG